MRPLPTPTALRPVSHCPWPFLPRCRQFPVMREVSRLLPGMSNVAKSISARSKNSKVVERARLIRAFTEAERDALNGRQVGPQAGLRQKFNLPPERRALPQPQRYPMQARTARYLRHGNIRQRNRSRHASAANLEPIPAIQHLIGQPVHLRFPIEIDQGDAKQTDRNGAWQRISQKIS